MSEGVFTRGFYEADNGDILPIRYQPETVIATVNPAQAGPATAKGSVRTSASTRSNGTVPRIVYGAWTSAPTNYKAGGSVKLPIFTKDAFDAIDIYDEVTYLGGTFVVTGKRGESRR